MKILVKNTLREISQICRDNQLYANIQVTPIGTIMVSGEDSVINNFEEGLTSYETAQDESVYWIIEDEKVNRITEEIQAIIVENDLTRSQIESLRAKI